MDGIELIEVLSRLESTSSGIGVSYYTHSCARQARLDQENPRAGDFKMSVGTVIHKLMHLYYTGMLNGVVLPISDKPDLDNDPIQEGLRVFAAYMKFHPAEEWRIISAERRLPREGNAADEAALLKCFGQPMATRPDMKVYIDEAQAAEIKERCGIEIIPGFYLIDHKTHEQKTNGIVMKSQLSVQFTVYMMAERAIFNEPIEGLIVNDLVRHKDLYKMENGHPRSFSRYFVPFPSEAQQDMVRAYLAWKADWLKQDKAEIGACVDFISGRVCSHFTEGRCSRI